MRLRTAALVVLLSCLVAMDLHATPIYQWSHSYGNAADQYLGAVAADPFGNVLLCGSFYGSITFSSTITSLGFSDMFVAKLDPNGNPLWNRRIGFGVTADAGRDIVSDRAGNVIAVGGAGPSGTDAVIAKWAPDGTQQWIKYFGSFGGDASAEAVATDAAREIVVAGRFGGLMVFGSDSLYADGQSDIFLVKFDQNGNPLWSKHFASGEGTAINGLEVDPAGQVILFGEFYGTINFGGGVLTSVGSADLFLAKFAPTGDPMWSHRYGGAAYLQPGCLAVSESGRAAIAANLNGTADFGGGLLTPTGFPEACVAVFAPEGNHVWSRNFPSSAYSFAQGMTFAQNSDLVFSCYGWGTIDFGGGPVSPTGFFYNLYIARLFQIDGAHRWSTAYAGDGNVSGYIDDYNSDVILAGDMEGTTDFGGGPLSNAGFRDVFVARFGDVLTAVGRSPAIALLEQNVPNPFNPETAIPYTLDAPAAIVIAIYDASGTPVARLDAGHRPAGSYSVAWNGRDNAGHTVASGVYFYRIEGVPGVDARKMVLLK